MRIYTLTECCALFEVNAKTFRKWLEREGMQPQKSRADTRIRYLTREQVEHLAEVYDCALPPDEEPVPKGENTSDLATLLAERVDRQERRLENLEREVRQTQASMAVLQQQVSVYPYASASTDQSQQSRQPEQRDGSSEHRPMPKARTKTRFKKGGKGLPRTLVLLRVFAEQHHVPLKAADRASKAGKIAVVRGRWLVNSRYATEALGARGQQDFYDVFYGRDDFTRCERCPHQAAP
jgi:DNA-binding transcriptional MerR regulator